MASISPYSVGWSAAQSAARLTNSGGTSSSGSPRLNRGIERASSTRVSCAGRSTNSAVNRYRSPGCSRSGITAVSVWTDTRTSSSSTAPRAPWKSRLVTSPASGTHTPSGLCTSTLTSTSGPRPSDGDLRADAQVLAGDHRAGSRGLPLGAAVGVHRRDPEPGAVGKAPDGDDLVLPDVLIGVVAVRRQRAGFGQRIERGLHLVPEHEALGGSAPGRRGPTTTPLMAETASRPPAAARRDRDTATVPHRSVAVVPDAHPGDREGGEHHALEEQRGRATWCPSAR